MEIFVGYLLANIFLNLYVLPNILIYYEKEGNSAVCNNMNGP